MCDSEKLGGEHSTNPRSARDAVTDLYELYADDVYKYALYTLRNPPDANDVVQEVYFRAFRSWNTFRHEAQARTWLLTIARHHIYDVLRKRKKDRTLIKQYIPQLGEGSRIIQDSLLDLEEIVRGLKDGYRHVFVLRHVNMLPVKDVADILGWTEAKVRTTDHRAIRFLRESYVRRMEGVEESHDG